MGHYPIKIETRKSLLSTRLEFLSSGIGGVALTKNGDGRTDRKLQNIFTLRHYLHGLGHKIIQINKRSQCL